MLRTKFSNSEISFADLKESIDKSWIFPDQYIFLYSSYSSSIVYHKGIDEFLGLKIKLLNNVSLISFIHKDDKDQAKSIYNRVYRYWLRKDISPSEQVLTVKYKIIDAKKNIKNVCCRTMVIVKNAKEIVTLNLVSDISQFNTGSNMLWSLTGKDSYRFYELNRIITEQHSLTSRELEIIKCLAKGMNSKETANFLKISLYTVYTHRRNMLTKMNFDNILQLVNFAFKKGLINV